MKKLFVCFVIVYACSCFFSVHSEAATKKIETFYKGVYFDDSKTKVKKKVTYSLKQYARDSNAPGSALIYKYPKKVRNHPADMYFSFFLTPEFEKLQSVSIVLTDKKNFKTTTQQHTLFNKLTKDVQKKMKGKNPTVTKYDNKNWTATWTLSAKHKVSVNLYEMYNEKGKKQPYMTIRDDYNPYPSLGSVVLK